jgi:hypothetical protein
MVIIKLIFYYSLFIIAVFDYIKDSRDFYNWLEREYPDA